MTKHSPLTPAQESALLAYAAAHGRCWKAALRKEWDDMSPNLLLQALRISPGEAWLKNFKIDSIKPKQQQDATQQEPATQQDAQEQEHPTMTNDMIPPPPDLILVDQTPAYEMHVSMDNVEPVGGGCFRPVLVVEVHADAAYVSIEEEHESYSLPYSRDALREFHIHGPKNALVMVDNDSLASLAEELRPHCAALAWCLTHETDYFEVAALFDDIERTCESSPWIDESYSSWDVDSYAYDYVKNFSGLTAESSDEEVENIAADMVSIAAQEKILLDYGRQGNMLAYIESFRDNLRQQAEEDEIETDSLYNGPHGLNT